MTGGERPAHLELFRAAVAAASACLLLVQQRLPENAQLPPELGPPVRDGREDHAADLLALHDRQHVVGGGGGGGGGGGAVSASVLFAVGLFSPGWV